MRSSETHIPILRHGSPYRSLDAVTVKDIRTGEPLAQVSQANAGLIRRDARKAQHAFDLLQSMRCDELIAVSQKAGDLFLKGDLPLDTDGTMQSPDDYVRMLSATSGLPHVMVRRNMEKIHYVLANMRAILAGLTRGLDTAAIDEGYGTQAGVAVSYFPAARQLAAVLPSNSPGVHSLWVPAIAMKMPLVLKPGSEEPWTPWRIAQAFIAAGCPREAICFYPTTHEGSQAILELAGRALLFGDKATVQRYAGDPRIEVHGPGYSKVLIGEDEIDRWESHLEVMLRSILDNGGRSCINASTIVVPRHGRAIADALAQRMATIEPTAADDPEARLSAFANPAMARAIDAMLDESLKDPTGGGAVDRTAYHRKGARLVEHEGATFLRPTLAHCGSFDHPLANTEYLFPFATVVEVPQSEMVNKIGPSLVVSAITHDRAWQRQLLACPFIDRLNLGALPTSVVQWDQPHEGNLFEFLYRRRAIQYENV